MKTAKLCPPWISSFVLLFSLASAPGCEFADDGKANGTDGGGTAGAGGSTGSTGTAGTGTGGTGGSSGGSGGNPWIDVYYPGWRQSRFPPELLDLRGVTHLIHFAWIPWIPEGGTEITIDDRRNSVDAAAAAKVIAVGHAAGAKVIISIGGSADGSKFFNQAMADEHRVDFAKMLVAKTVERGYDGIDLDWEPGYQNVTAATTALYQQFSRDVRAEINATAPQLLLLTAGLGAQSGVFGPVADVYDQVNIMSYDLVYGNPLTWHNSPLRGGGGGYYSIERSVNEYVGAKVPKAKVGIGLKCGGYSWENATEPMQSPAGAQPKSIAYNVLIPTLFTDAVAKWDEKGQVPYLSITGTPSMFVTYDDPRSSKAKIDYLKQGGYGGIIIWDPTEQYFASGDSAGRKNPLLEAVQDAVAGK